MGVDFYTCDHCGESFPDCGHYVRCRGEDCGRMWCSKACAVAEGHSTDEDGEQSCSFCRDEAFTDSQLLSFVLKQTLHWTREQAVEYYQHHLHTTYLEDEET